MKRYALSVVIGLALGVVVAERCSETEPPMSDAERAATRHTMDSLKALLAESEMRVPKVVDTVRSIVTTTRTLRDSVMLFKTDTILLERYVYQMDTLRRYCNECAELLESRTRASETFISMLQGEVKRARVGPRFRVHADALRDIAAGDWRLGADTDMRLFGRVRGLVRAEQWVVEGESPRLFVGVRTQF